MLGASTAEVAAEKNKLKQFEERDKIKPLSFTRVDKTKVQALQNQIVKATTERYLLQKFAKGI